MPEPFIPPEALNAATILVLDEFLKLLDEHQARPPTTPAMKEYQRGYRDALLDLRIILKKKIEAGQQP